MTRMFERRLGTGWSLPRRDYDVPQPGVVHRTAFLPSSSPLAPVPEEVGEDESDDDVADAAPAPAYVPPVPQSDKIAILRVSPPRLNRNGAIAAAGDAAFRCGHTSHLLDPPFPYIVADPAALAELIAWRCGCPSSASRTPPP